MHLAVGILRVRGGLEVEDTAAALLGGGVSVDSGLDLPRPAPSSPDTEVSQTLPPIDASDVVHSLHFWSAAVL